MLCSINSIKDAKIFLKKYDEYFIKKITKIN